jgi:hypothetical protein
MTLILAAHFGGFLPLDIHRPGLPDVGAVITDGAIGGELADAGYVEDAHAGSFLLPLCEVSGM